MIARLRQMSSTQDVNKYLRISASYLWIGTGTLFACYLYVVGSLTFSMVKQQDMEQSIKGLISTMSTQELSYLSVQRHLTEDSAGELGLVPASSLSFAREQRVFAWNVGR